MPRYEFSEGTSNKFWEITLSGTGYTTTWGRIGTEGQSKTQEFGTAEKAKKEYDKIVAEKVKKGYQLVDDDGGSGEEDESPSQVEFEGDDEEEEETAAPARTPTGGARRFEFTEGASSKFWEIALEGGSFTTKWGRIGTEGQSKTQQFGSAADAKKAYDKIVAEKEKKGYQEVGGGGGGGDDDEGGGGGSTFAWNDELEATILKSPGDPKPLLVYADWLQANGNPVGELISLQHGNKKPQADKLIKTHLKSWLGGAAADALECGDLSLTWKNGFIDRVWVGQKDYDSQTELAEVLERVLTAHVGRFVSHVTLGLSGYEDGEPSAQAMVDKLIELAPKSVTSLEACDFEYPDQTEMSWAYVDDVSKLWKALPQLKQAVIRAGNFTLGTIDAPELLSFRAETGGLNPENLQSICSAKWPKLESLHVWFGSDNYGWDGGVDDVKDLLDAKGLGRVKHLGLMNADFTNELIPLLAKSTILKQLETLDLSMGVLNDEGVEALVAHAAAFKHLKKLDLSESYLTPKGIKRAKTLGAMIVVSDQREPYGDDPDDRYVAVSE